MKKVVICISFLLLCLPLFSQTSIGKFVQFPDGGFVGSAVKPNLTFAQISNPETTNFLVLCVTHTDTYADFDENSRLLIKFEDNEKFTIPIFPGVKSKDYDYIGSVSLYSTFTYYKIDEKLLQKILSYSEIVKIRIVFTNGDIEDYDIDEFYQSKFIKKLVNEYNNVCRENSARQNNMNDDDF